MITTPLLTMQTVKIAALLLTILAAFIFGSVHGQRKVQIAWDKETIAREQAVSKNLGDALDESRKLSLEAEERNKRDLEAAIRASEERQAARVVAAVRQASIEAATRQEGSAYVDERCRLDAETYEKLLEAMK